MRLVGELNALVSMMCNMLGGYGSDARLLSLGADGRLLRTVAMMFD